MGDDGLRDPNKERVGVYLNRETGSRVFIEGPDKGLYRMVYEAGRVQPLGTIVTQEDIKGLERISDLEEQKIAGTLRNLRLRSV